MQCRITAMRTHQVMLERWREHGRVSGDLTEQIIRIPDNGSDVIVAIGGNDALRNSDLRVHHL